MLRVETTTWQAIKVELMELCQQEDIKFTSYFSERLSTTGFVCQTIFCKHFLLFLYYPA